MNINERHTLTGVFSYLGVDVEVSANGDVTVSEQQLSSMLQSLDSVRQIRDRIHSIHSADTLREIDRVLNGDDRTMTVADLGCDVQLDGSVVIPAGDVLELVVELDLAARLRGFDDVSAGDTYEELHFLFAAADRLQVVELGDTVRDAAGVITGSELVAA